MTRDEKDKELESRQVVRARERMVKKLMRIYDKNVRTMKRKQDKKGTK